VAGEGLGSLASSGRGTWSSVVLAHTAILDREMFSWIWASVCLPARQCGRSVLAVVHGQHWWSLTGRTLNDGPNVLQKSLNRVGSLTMVGFESAARIARARNAGDREQRGSFDRVDLQALVCFLPLVAA